MRLVQLIYCSRVVTGVHGTAITSIVDVSRFNNARDGVTGALCFNANFFLQCLEGERGAVNETYHRILRDPRHEGALLLRYDEVSKRQFGDWSMGYLSSQAMAPDLLLQYGSNDRFDPEQLGADAALDFLLALKSRSIRLRDAA
ncbi:MAG: BLUF domain-containing protein [Rhodanobacteraceae bacterium]|nr:BLUF domain-containing protein [Rhodanobacteraceae bacterium]MBL0042790.1 BLUF domain-containing protein [Xanthomonadales bacterium]